MRSRASHRIAHVLAAGLVALLAGGAAADAVSGVLAHDGDTLATAIDAPGDADVFTVPIAAGATLGVQVKAAKGTALLPTLRLRAPDGTEVTPTKPIKNVGVKPQIKLQSFVVPEGASGVWTVELGGAGDTTGAYTVSFSVKPPKAVKVKALAVPAAGTGVVPFGAESGAEVSVSIKAKGKSAAAGAFLTGPAETEIDGSRAAFTAKGTKLQLKKLPVAVGCGTHGVVVEGGEAAATVSVAVKVRFPRHEKRKVSKKDSSGVLPPEVRLDAVVDGDVRQEDVRTRIEVTGAEFLDGTTAVVSGEGVTVDDVTVVDAGTLAVDVSVAADAAFGLRDLTVVPPPALGEPHTLAEAVRVLAPLPTVTGTTTPIVKQADDEATIVVTGTGFRAGGSVAVEEPGVTVTGVTLDSAAQLTVTASVDADAELGPRDVTYTQPAAGGGDAATAADLVRVNYPDPVIDSVDPPAVRQLDAGTVVTVIGSGFRTGASVAVGGSGVTVQDTTVLGDAAIEVTLDVDGAAAYGARDVTVTQAAEGGGASDVAAGALTVRAPDPVVTSVSPAALTQGDANVLVTVTGQHFRQGGSVSLAGSGLTVSAFTFVSATQATVRVSADDDASLGPQDVTFTQPAAGGGAAGVLSGGLQIDAPTPTASAISVSTVKQLDTGVEITFTGGELRDGGTITVSGTGFVYGDTVVDSRTTARVTVDVEEFATLGLRDVTFTQPVVGGGRSATLTGVLTVLYPDPTISLVVPDGVRRTKSGTIRLLGEGFRTGGVVTTDGTGVTLGTPSVVSGQVLDVPYSVAADAPFGDNDITYTQPSNGGGASVTFADAYGVFSAPPTFTSITPAQARPGDTFLPCVVIGGNIEDGSTVSFSSSDVAVEDVVFVSGTRIEFVVSVASTAALGTVDLLIEPSLGPPEPFEDVFAVVAAEPTVTAFSHATLAQGADDVAVEVHGTNFRDGDVLSASGSGVSFANVSVESSTLLTADVSVTGSATTGLRALTVTHAASDGGRAGTLADAFEIIGTGPTVSAIVPAQVAATPSGGRTRVVTARVTGTRFMSGAGVSVAQSGGSGVSVVSGSVHVLSDTELEVQLAVTAAASTGTWDVTVTNPGDAGGSGTSGDDVLAVVDEFTLTVNQLIPASGSTYGGERVVVTGGGFVIGSVVDFGSQRAYLAQTVDDNTIVCVVPPPAAASATGPTEVTVTVTTPSGSASRVAAYAYARDTQTLFVERTYPPQGATGVPATLARCAVLLSAPASTLPSYSGSSSTYPESTLYWSELSGSGVASGAASLDPTGRWLVFTRNTTSALSVSAGGVYEVSVPSSVTSLSGRHLVSVNATSDTDDVGYDAFTHTVSSSTSDTTAPTVAGGTPAAGESNVSTNTAIEIVMSEEIDPLTVNTTNVTLKQGNSSIGFHLAVGDDLKTLTLSPHGQLQTSRTYTVRLMTGIRDLHGNALASTVTRTFATGSGTDLTGPTIDPVVVEGLPASVDGSGTYVAGADSTGSSSNPQAASAGSTTAFDLFVPRSGFELRVTYADGGIGVDETTFSAKCSVAVGSASANTELASHFDVTAAGATWRIPATALVATGEDVTFSFTIDDLNGNSSSTRTVTLDVGALNATSQSSTGGNLDPFDSRQTWVLRGDLDRYTSTYSEATVEGVTFPRMTTTNQANDVNDLDEALRLVGLETDSMTSAAAAATNGISVGTNAIMRRLVLERVRELVRERFGIDADGTRSADSPEIEFLLPGEQGSLSALPAYSSSPSTGSSNAYSEISLGGTQGAESDGAATSGIESASAFDVRNLSQEALLNTNGTYGVFVGSMFKERIGDGQFDLTGTSQAWRGMTTPFGRYVLAELNETWGGTPVGEHASDDDVLSGTFDRSTSSNTTHNDRYDAIFTAVETVSLWVSCNVAAEIGQSTGLVPDGGPKTGLFGHAHRSNTFTDATTSRLNVSHRIYWAGINNLMAPDGTLFEKIRTGSDHRQFNPLAMAWLRRRLLYDEGQ